METASDNFTQDRNVDGLFDRHIARFTLKPHPKAVPGLCKRPNCRRKECRDAYHKEQYERLNLGVEELLKREEPVWFITLEPANASQPTRSEQEIREFKSRISEFWESLARAAKKDGTVLRYAYVVGIKTRQATSPYQLHIHAIVNWVPNPEEKPTSAYPYHHMSQKLDKKAAALALKAWLEKAESPYGVARYLRNNLIKLNEAEIKSDIMLPRGFRRVGFSQNWAKLPYKKSRAKTRDLQKAVDDEAQPKEISATPESDIQNNILLPVRYHINNQQFLPPPYLSQQARHGRLPASLSSTTIRRYSPSRLTTASGKVRNKRTPKSDTGRKLLEMVRQSTSCGYPTDKRVVRIQKNDQQHSDLQSWFDQYPSSTWKETGRGLKSAGYSCKYNAV